MYIRRNIQFLVINFFDENKFAARPLHLFLDATSIKGYVDR